MDLKFFTQPLTPGILSMGGKNLHLMHTLLRITLFVNRQCIWRNVIQSNFICYNETSYILILKTIYTPGSVIVLSNG